MAHIRKDDVDRLLREFYAAKISKHYGDTGVKRLHELAAALDRIHSSLAYEKLAGGLTVMISLDPNEELLPSKNRVEVQPTGLPAVVAGTAAIQVIDQGRLLVVPEPRDPLAYADKAVVYHFKDRDYFVIDGALEKVINTTQYPSLFGTPTFFVLDESLDEYGLKQALHSQCPVLRNEAWSDSRRWWLANRPEDKLQKSLHLHVRTTVRGVAEVRREQIVGTRPTDLKVTWSLTNRIAYIEIKWLGASLNAAKTRKSKTFSPKAARDGANQLAEYLDLNKDEAALHDTMGYLVVFDGRRRGLRLDRKRLSRANGEYFRARDVTYDPKLWESRSDYAKPRRFFLEPSEVSD